MIIQELQHIQERIGFLPADELTALSKRLNVPLHRIHEVASFYPHFRKDKPAAVEIAVCRDMACHLRGAPLLHQALTSIAGETGGGRVKVSGVSCLGQCDCPVALALNHHIYRGLSEESLRTKISTALSGMPLEPQHADRTPLTWKIDPYQGHPRYDAVKRLVEKKIDADGVLKALEAAALRGMGGAGFPTSRKWATVRKEQAVQKYIVCNADESEPGTFKDRELLRRAPYLTIEGMILAALVTGATKGSIYIRHEFEEEIDVLRDALADAQRNGLLGGNVLGSGAAFHLDLFVSPGGYIQGEESALLEAMEDRRGEPRNKPPFPVFKGLFGQPTVINNVETLSWTPSIVLNGGDWYRALGTHGASGMRFVSICGDVVRPGAYEVPLGQTVRELIFDTAGGMAEGMTLKAIATSGPSGGFLPAELAVESLPPKFVQEKVPAGAKTFSILDLNLDFNTVPMMGGMLGAAFVVYGDRRDMVDQALNAAQFYRNESCGKCVPCRMGSQKLTDLITDLVAGRLRREQLEVVQELADTMTITSICGLGMVAANPVVSVLKYFMADVEKHLTGTAAKLSASDTRKK